MDQSSARTARTGRAATTTSISARTNTASTTASRATATPRTRASTALARATHRRATESATLAPGVSHREGAKRTSNIRATLDLRGLLVVLPGFGIIRDALSLAQLLEAAEHLFSCLITSALDSDRHRVNSFGLEGERLLQISPHYASSRESWETVGVPVVIDTNNVLHVTGALPPELAGVDEAGLAALVNGSRHASDAVCFVCDGAPRGRPTAPIGAVQFIYSGSKTSADAIIARLVDACTAPRAMTVVTDDRAVARHAARRRCRIEGGAEFLRRLALDIEARAARSDLRPLRPRMAPLSAEQVDAWKAYFGLADPASLTRLASAAREGPAHRRPHDRRQPRHL